MPNLVKRLRDRSRILSSIHYLLKYREIDLRHRAIREFCRDPVNSPLVLAEVAQPLNGQFARRRCFQALFAEFRPEVVVETGTNLGTSTLFFRKLVPGDVEVHTVELDDLYHRFAAARFRRAGADIRQHRTSSEAFLETFDPSGKRLFCYLDAHWYQHLPIRAEIAALSRHREVLAAIDDFEVPGIGGFGFDDYGSRGALTWSHVRDVASGFAAFYPAYTPEEDQGARRGLCVLARGVAARRACEESGLLVASGSAP